MKTLKFAILSMFIATTLCNCSSHEEEDPCGCRVPAFSYSLYLSFHDASGNDLVKELDFLVWDRVNAVYKIGEEEAGRGIVDPELYEIVFPDKIAKFWNRETVLYLSKEYKYERFNYAILEFDTFSPITLPFAEKITYKLNYPDLFGDNLTHEIVSYWKFIKTDNDGGGNVLCYRIEFGGKEFTVTDGHIVTIVLDR